MSADNDLTDWANDKLIESSVPVVLTSPEDELAAGLRRNSVGMALALNAKPIYEGTVPGYEKAKRRAVGRRQRKARKVHR